MSMLSLNKQLVNRRFSRAAQRYDELASVQRAVADHLLDCAEPYVRSATRVLDVGCGTGYLLGKYSGARREQSLIGLDLSSNMLEQASLGVPNAEFIQGDIERLPLEDGCVDLVLSSSALQWCDAKQSMQEIHRVLKPGGQVVVSSFVQGTLAAWRELWGQGSDRFYEFGTFVSQVENCGLSVQCHSHKPFRHSYSSFESAVASVRELGAGGTRDSRRGLMGKSKYQWIRAQVEREITRSGAYSMEYRAVFLVASKVV